MTRTDLSPATECPAAEIAPDLKMSRERVVRLVQMGRIQGRRDPERGWLVSRAAAAAFAGHVGAIDNSNYPNPA